VLHGGSSEISRRLEIEIAHMCAGEPSDQVPTGTKNSAHG
jgi:hypothetical protein